MGKKGTFDFLFANTGQILLDHSVCKHKLIVPCSASVGGLTSAHRSK